MLNAQAAAIADALVSAGIAPDAASKIAKILGNPEQALYHAGPQKVDVTPRAMRKITPEVRQHQLQNIDFREADPDYRAPIHRATEESPPPVPQPLPLSASRPQASKPLSTWAASSPMSPVRPG